MNPITKNRVKLIRAMITAGADLASIKDANVIELIREDNLKHYLSTSQDVDCQISYARTNDSSYGLVFDFIILFHL